MGALGVWELPCPWMDGLGGGLGCAWKAGDGFLFLLGEAGLIWACVCGVRMGVFGDQIRNTGTYRKIFGDFSVARMGDRTGIFNRPSDFSLAVGD